MRKLFSIVLILLMMLLAVAFTSLNLGAMAINLYFIHVDLPIAVAIFLFLLLGAILGVMASSGLWLRQARTNRKLRRRLENCDKELASLRNLPVKDPS
ncbi:LapA family protein [Acidihalobacter prosperus]|uniref:Lipopolysaccharide assembly protein A domain-containing protein n=1 Tax=Acidihalobacter prosperus TaxID=160660 RepID=A0A1A6C7E2_9GAMM|nr:LapA family protein [Acidihalobacter prosperus]OBS10481.1 hypothetical protein Thpro_020197 [Acidihalobacter prosperus]